MKKNTPGFLMAVFSTLIIGCRQNGKATLSAKDFETIILKTEQKSGNSYQTLYYLDSIYKLYPNAEIDFKFKYLTYACGFYHINIQNDDSALIYADSMVSLVNNRTNKKLFPDEEAYANMSKGDILFAQKKYQSAYHYYFLGKVAAEKSLDPCTYSEYSYRLGMVLYRQSAYLKAAEYFKTSFHKSTSCPNSFRHFTRQQEVLSNTGLSYFKSNVFDSALLYYNKTLSFLNENEKNFPNDSAFLDVARGVVYGNLAQVYAVSDFNKAEQLYKKSIRINSQPHADNNDALLTQMHLAQLYVSNHKWDEAVGVLKLINTGLDTIKNEQAEIEWNNLMWKYYDEKKDSGSAYKYLYNYENLKNKEALANKDLNESNVVNEMESLQSQYEVNLLKEDEKINTLYLLLLLGGLALLLIIIFLIGYNWRNSINNNKTLEQLNHQIENQKKELQEAFDELERQNKQKDAILRVVAHDLRTPINSIHASARILNEMYELSAEQHQFLKIIETASADTREMITSILDVAGNSIGKSSVKQLVDIDPIVNHCVQLLQFKAAEKKQSINIVSADNNLKVLGNEENLRRVVNNVIGNAIKFSPVGSAIDIKILESGEYAEILVRDKGIGIPATIQDKVFDMFTEAKRYGTNNERPFGLGLAICKQIIEDHQGKIWFESKEQNGTTFYIQLPKK